jgi:hypothetical protein
MNFAIKYFCVNLTWMRVKQCYAGKHIMEGTERRKYNRLGVEFDLSFREVGSSAEQTHTGCTVNVSPGGLYFETDSAPFKPGKLLEVELSIPPRKGLLEFGGRISGFARILRTYGLSGTDTNLSSGKFGIAAQFCRSPKLCM